MGESSISKGVGEVGHIIMVIVFFALVLGSILSVDLFSNIDVTSSVTNETLSAVNATVNSSFAILSTYPAATCTLTSLVNATDAAVVPASNYTFYTDCNLILTAGSDFIDEDVNITYGYTYTSNNTLAGIDVTSLSAIFAAFVVAITSFIVIGGTLLGILWILPFIKPLFKKDALGMSD